LDDDVAATPLKMLSWREPPGFELGAGVHDSPFQCSASVWLRAPAPWVPTAQALQGESTATDWSESPDAAGLAGWLPAQLTHDDAVVVAPALGATLTTAPAVITAIVTGQTRPASQYLFIAIIP
jgi:hypothetical protein